MTRKRNWLPNWPWVLLALAAFLCLPAARAQFTPPYVVVQGALTTASGTAAKNATLTFNPSQVFFVGGSQVVVGEAQCSTDTNGQVVGLPNPLVIARVSKQTGVGTLPAGTYFVKFAWYDQFGGVTLPSPEASIQLASSGELQILPPVGNGPPNATGMNVYIGTTPGGETLQGQTTSTTAQFTQAASLTTGASPGITNSSACRVVANDAGWPTGTGYQVSLVDASGNTLFTYSEMWQFLGPGSTYNLSNGIPYYHGQVTYPVPVLTIPYNHNPQSISGPLSMTGYNVYNVGEIGVGTALPTWGVDVEGSGATAAVNANQGYLVNGAAGTAGQGLCSDGTYLDQLCSFLSSSTTIYYQSVKNVGVFEPQEPALGFVGNGWILSDVPGASTNFQLNLAGTGAQVVATNGLGTTGHCAVWTAAGVGDSGAPCLSATFTDYYFTFTGCSVVNSGNLNACSGTAVFSGGGCNTSPCFAAMPDNGYIITCTVDTGTVSSASFSVKGLSTSATPTFTRTITQFDYVWTEVMSLGGDGSNAPSINCHLHHS